ncbi:MAG: hypothetical protein QOE61_505 [Micromonosporaceae bacterium]|jgi:hypothetical protein|nr:hypothetical protein [Micromonosporaceae bacterium]
MTTSDDRTGPSDQYDQLDLYDYEILDGLQHVHEQLDGPPPELVDRVLFAMAATNLEAEIARLQQDELIGSGARGSELTRTINFDADTLTIMVTLVEMPDGLLRIDGWLAPAAAWRIELRRNDVPDGSAFVTADDGGRFVFPAVPYGAAQLIVHRDTEPSLSDVVTPAVLL